MLNRRNMLKVSATSLALAAAVPSAVGAAPSITPVWVVPAEKSKQSCLDFKFRTTQWVNVYGREEYLIEYYTRYGEHYRPFRSDTPKEVLAEDLENRRKFTTDLVRCRLKERGCTQALDCLTALGDGARANQHAIAMLGGDIIGKLNDPSPQLFAVNEGFDQWGNLNVTVKFESMETFWWFDEFRRTLINVIEFRNDIERSHPPAYCGEGVEPESVRGIMGEASFAVKPDSVEYAALREATDAWMYHHGFLLPLENQLML